MTKTVTTGKATDLITFTRSTTGTYLDSVKYGDELVTNGTFDTDSDWIFQTGKNWTISNGKLNAANSTGYTKQNGVVENNKTYKVTLDAVVTSGSFRMVTTADPSTYTSYITTSGSYVFIISPVSSVSGGFEFIGTGFTGSIDNVSVKEIIGNQGTSGEPLLRTANTNEPRIEYDADGNLKGLLIEEQRTNLLTYSEAFTPNWSTTRATISETNETAPDGTTSVKKIIPNTNNLNHYVYQPYSAGTHTWTVFAKAAEYGRISLWEGGVTGKYASYDLRSGTILSSNADSKSITPYGNGWYRCSITVTVASGTPYFLIAALNDTVTSPYQSFEGDDVSGTYIWGGQLETGTFPTSYIPTSGSTVTRNADVATINVSEFEYSQNEGTVVVDFIPTDHPSSTYNQLIVSDGGSKRWVYFNDTATYSVAGFDGTNQIAITGVLAPIKAAIGLSSTQGSIAANGDASANSTDVAHNGNILTSTSFDIAANTTAHIKSVQYYPLRLTNNQLKALTQ